jgi:hypothetical protein
MEVGSSRSHQIRKKDPPIKIPTLVNGLTEVNTKHTRHTLKSNTQPNRDNKIVILGDSHAWGLSSNVKNNLGNNYSVCSIVKPAGNIATQISSTVNLNLLTKNDAIIFWGSANDVSRKNSQKGLNQLVNFVQSNSHTSILLMCIPPRHDLPEWSCVNNETKVFNRKLVKVMKQWGSKAGIGPKGYYRRRQIISTNLG